jgi:hypothetical protein
MDLIETDNEEENFVGTPPVVTEAAAKPATICCLRNHGINTRELIIFR